MLYGLYGMRWTGRVSPGEAITVVVTSGAQGEGAFMYDVAGEGRTALAQACFEFLPVRAGLDLGGWGDLDIFSH